MLTAKVNEQTCRHILDYFWGADEQPVVVDVVRHERLERDAVHSFALGPAPFPESRGWTYTVVSEPDPTYLANIRFWRDDAAACQSGSAWANFGRGESSWAVRRSPSLRHLTRTPKATGIRPALMHLIWCHELIADLTQPLRRRRYWRYQYDVRGSAGRSGCTFL